MARTVTPRRQSSSFHFFYSLDQLSIIEVSFDFVQVSLDPLILNTLD